MVWKQNRKRALEHTYVGWPTIWFRSSERGPSGCAIYMGCGLQKRRYARVPDQKSWPVQMYDGSLLNGAQCSIEGKMFPSVNQLQRLSLRSLSDRSVLSTLVTQTAIMYGTGEPRGQCIENCGAQVDADQTMGMAVG